MKQLRIVLIVLISLLFYACASTWAPAVKDTIRIEHVYNKPSIAYGPATVVLYTKASGYTRACWPWQLLDMKFEGIDERDYKSKAEIYHNCLVKYPIADVKIGTSGEIKFGIKLDAREKAKLSAGFQRISEIRIELTDGSQYEAPATINELYEKIKQNGCQDAIRERLRAHPKAKVYLVLTTYGYDINISVKIGNEWKAAADLPKEVLDVISAKLNLNIKKDKELKTYGKQLFVGFNGDAMSLPQKTEAKEVEVEKSIELYDYIRRNQSKENEIIRIIDMTNLFYRPLSDFEVRKKYR